MSTMQGQTAQAYVVFGRIQGYVLRMSQRR